MTSAAQMIDSSFISQGCGITQQEHINHPFLWQRECAALCSEKLFFFPRHVTLLVWQGTINHRDWQLWWVTLFTQCIMKDHVTRYCCYRDNSIGLDLWGVGALLRFTQGCLLSLFCSQSSSTLSFVHSLLRYTNTPHMCTQWVGDELKIVGFLCGNDIILHDSVKFRMVSAFFDRPTRDGDFVAEREKDTTSWEISFRV